MNSFQIIFNIPLVAVGMWFAKDDPVYFMLLCFMILIKMGLSAMGAKVRQYLANPRYSKNAEKLKKIMSRQSEKMKKREQILGKETIQQIEGVSAEDTKSRSGSGGSSSQNLLSSAVSDNVLDGSSIKKELLRDKLLE